MNNTNDGTLSENPEGDVNFSPRRQEWSISHIDKSCHHQTCQSLRAALMLL